LAIFTVVKVHLADAYRRLRLIWIQAGFVWSGRVGSGVVIARLPDQSWSAPSCIGTGGVGFGLQIGADISEFVVRVPQTGLAKRSGRTCRRSSSTAPTPSKRSVSLAISPSEASSRPQRDRSAPVERSMRRSLGQVRLMKLDCTLKD
jgi:hypothetical protein